MRVLVRWPRGSIRTIVVLMSAFEIGVIILIGLTRGVGSAIGAAAVAVFMVGGLMLLTRALREPGTVSPLPTPSPDARPPSASGALGAAAITAVRPPQT